MKQKQQCLSFTAARMVLSLFLIMVAGIGNVWGDSWTRCTAVSDLTSGGTFIIGYEATANSGVIVPMQNTGTASTSAAGLLYSGTTSGSTGSETIDMSSVTETSLYEVTIAKSTTVDGAITIKCGDNYVGNTNTKNNLKLFASEATTTSFTLTVGTNDVFTLKIAANETYTTLQYNSGSPRFAVYSGTQKNVVIYKKVTSPQTSKTTTTTSFGDTKAYTTYTDETFSAPTATVKAGETSVTSPAVTYKSNNTAVATVDETKGAVTIVAAGTTTITATYAGDDIYAKSSDSYTLTVGQTYAGLQALQGNTSTTAVDMKVTLTDVYVTGVNGSNAYLSDGTYGALVYTENHGLTAGKKLNGTLMAKVQLYRGQTEITAFSADGLSVTDEAATAAEVTDLSTITAANQGKLVTLKNVKFDGTNLVDANSKTIQPYNTLGVETSNFVKNASYDVTGVIVVYNTTIEIAPRTTDDLVKLDSRTAPTISWKSNDVEITEFTVENGQEWTAPVFSTNSTGKVTYSSSNTEAATIDSENGTITLNAAGETKITASVAETDDYYAAETSYTLKVRDVASLPFTFDGGKADLTTVAGYVSSELGTDYTSSPKLKFDTQGDNLVIKYDAAADKLRYTVKATKTNSAWTAQFDVMESADGTEYTAVKSYTTMATDATTETCDLKETSRYVKFVYTSRTAGNVALGNITIKHTTQLPPAANLKANDVTKNSANLAWDAVEDASSYEVKYKASSADDWTTASATTNSYALTGLAVSTTYSWSVKPVGDGFDYADATVANGTDFTTSAASLLTVTFKDVNKEDVSLTETEENGGVTPPATSTVGDYTFAGWSTTNVSEETTTAPEFVTITERKYYPSAATTLYAVYTTKKAGKKYGFTLSLVDNETTYYIGARSSGNSYFTGVTDASNALTIYEDGGYLYYMNGTTPTYFSGETTSKADITFKTTKSQPWTITETANGFTFKSEVTSRYLACNTSSSHRFATYGTTYPYEFTKTASSEYITVDLDNYTSSPSSEATPATSFASATASVDALDAEGNKNTYKQAVTTNSTGAVTYKSSDETVATVASDGTVTVVKGGEVKITATTAAVSGTWYESSAEYTLTINKMTPTIAFADNCPTEVYKDNSITVTATSYVGAKIVYASSNNSYATVTEAGIVTGVATSWTSSDTRSITIYAGLDESDLYKSVTGSSRAKLSVTVRNNAKTQTLAFTTPSYEFVNGETVEKFTNELTGAHTTVTYTSNNTSVAEVDETTGEVTVHTSAGGSATITATAAANDNVVEDNIRYNYSEAKQTYTIAVNYPRPTLSLAEGTYHSDQKVTLSGTNVETYYYTTNGDDVTFDAENITSNGTEYKSAIELTKGTTTLKVIAVYSDGSSYYAGAQATATYNLVAPDAPTASFENNTTVPVNQAVTLTGAEGTKITYRVLAEDLETVLVEETTSESNTASYTPTKYGTYVLEFSAAWNEEGGFACDESQYIMNVNGPVDVPFAYNDNTTNLPMCFEKNTISDYTTDNAKIAFKDQGASLVLQYGSDANKLTFCAMVNGTWADANVFVVSTSANGTDYTTLQTFTGSDNMLTTTATAYSYTLPTDARYIKWEYTTKSSGNVGLGNIILTNASENTTSVDLTERTDLDDDKVETILESTQESNANALVYVSSYSGSKANVVVKSGDYYTCANLVLTDKVTVDIPNAINASNITYQRGTSLAKGKYATVYLPYAFEPGDFKVLEFEDYTDNVVNFKYAGTTENPIKANTPYIIRPNGADDVDMSFNITGGSVAVATKSVALSSSLNFGENTTNAMSARSNTETHTGETVAGFYGTYETLNLKGGNGYYGFSATSGTFKKANTTNGTSIAPFRAFFYAGSSTSGARPASLGMNVPDDDTTTAVNAVLEAVEKGEAMYDLNGHRVAEPERGKVYIMGGKKVMIK